MATIRINIADALLSESAKAPSYKIAKVGGATTLVVNSAKKGELQSVLGHLKKAKAAAIAGISASIKSNTAATKANQLPKGDRRTKLMETRKAEKTKASAQIKTAKAELREANKTAKAHGLGGLNLPLSAADIKTGVGADKALKAIRSTKLTEFGVTGKRGTFKPKFLKEAAFDAVGTKAKKAPAKKEAAKAPFKRNKGIVAGAKSPTTARAAKIKRAAALTGKKLKPGGAERIAAAQEAQKKENAKNMKGLKNFFGGEFKASGMAYGPMDKKGGITFLNTKTGKSTHLNAADAKKHNIDVEELEGLLEDKGVKYSSSLGK